MAEPLITYDLSIPDTSNVLNPLILPLVDSAECLTVYGDDVDIKLVPLPSTGARPTPHRALQPRSTTSSSSRTTDIVCMLLLCGADVNRRFEGGA
ncbi:hypothetical protein MMC16_007524 [Acarospora aff. strigata]|nr:hypothetical protein [Acarospora aff. strigata]